MIRILVATDAWHPQVNGVVRSLDAVAREAPSLGAEIVFLTPAGFHSLPLPTYRDIRLSLCTPAMVGRRIAQLVPDYLHIATEGPIGWSVRRHCLHEARPFTTSYHTRFPEYLAARLPVPQSASYTLLRQFHNAACGTMVATSSLQCELEERGFRNVLRWSRGVNADLFRPRETRVLDLPRPIFLYVGRVAVEKNIEAFLALDLPGSKAVVGEGPQREALQARYPQAHFLGLYEGEALAKIYASSDVFVFPSRTDTFGIVLLEALASGLPIAAYPVAGPRDVIKGSDIGVLDEDLRRAAMAALAIPAARCRAFAMQSTWRESARQFIDNVISAQQGGEQACHSPVMGTNYLRSTSSQDHPLGLQDGNRSAHCL